MKAIFQRETGGGKYILGKRLATERWEEGENPISPMEKGRGNVAHNVALLCHINVVT